MAEPEKPKRSWQPRELRLVSEYINSYYPGQPSKTRVRLGSPHPELTRGDLNPQELNLIKVYSRWCDALIFAADRTVLIEGKIRAQLAGLAELLL